MKLELKPMSVLHLLQRPASSSDVSDWTRILEGREWPSVWQRWLQSPGVLGHLGTLLVAARLIPAFRKRQV